MEEARRNKKESFGGLRRSVKRDQPGKNSFSDRRQAFIMPGGYGIIFSERVGINERIKMRIPASSFLPAFGSAIGKKERAGGGKRDRTKERKKDGKGREKKRERERESEGG